MVKVRESRLWQWLSTAKKVLGPCLHLTRIENLVGQGMPDVEGCYLGRQFWMELKSEPRPIRGDTLIKPKFRPNQVPWMERRAGAGGRVYVLLQVGSGHFAARYLVPGNSVHRLQDGLTESQIEAISVMASHRQLKSLDFIYASTASTEPRYGR